MESADNFLDFNEIYLVQEFMPYDLHKVMRSHRLTNEHIQCIVYQLLRGLKYIHSANVIHRDLKPANILVNNECRVKICDFGLARVISDEGVSPSSLTEYVATRWYRAPEVMLMPSRYTRAMDLWSLGCILGEMYLRFPLFPGKNYRSQLLLMFKLLGTPTPDAIEFLLKRAKRYIALLPQYLAINFYDFFNYHPKRFAHFGIEYVDPSGLDLLELLLVLDPSARITANEALKHDFVKSFHQLHDEPVSHEILEPDTIDLANADEFSLADLKQYLFTYVGELRESQSYELGWY